MLAVSGVTSPVKNFQLRPDSLKYLRYYKIIQNVKNDLFYWAPDKKSVKLQTNQMGVTAAFKENTRSIEAIKIL